MTFCAAIKFLSIEPLLEDLGSFDISGIDWVIVGGESGHGARQMKEEWVEKILKLCRRQRVSFFFKQWGGVSQIDTGRLLRGKTYDEMPLSMFRTFHKGKLDYLRLRRGKTE